jgi:hypothetical protein
MFEIVGALIELTKGANDIGGGVNAADGGGRCTEEVLTKYVQSNSLRLGRCVLLRPTSCTSRFCDCKLMSILLTAR